MPEISLSDINEIFLNNPLKSFLDKARTQARLLSVHITGDNMKEQIQIMDEFETEQKKNIRQKYTRSNRDIFARIHRPIDKVFSANGGSTIINIPESKKPFFNQHLAEVRKGLSLRKWVQQYAMPAFQIDPNGLIFIEIDEKGIPYPTYKSTNDIFFYKTNGRGIELVIFGITIADLTSYATAAQQPFIIEQAKSLQPNAAQYYRIVDAVSDRIVKWDSKTITEIPGLTLNNPFGRCPAMIISDICQFNSDLWLSPDSDIVELANAILTDNSVFEIWKKLHMFPKHWRMASMCPTCMGNGKVNGTDCPDCNATGMQKRSSVRDELIVRPPEPGEKNPLPTSFDGYSTPPIDAWKLATDDLDRLEEHMYRTMWDCAQQNKPGVNIGTKTATQVLDESNNKYQRLYSLSEWAESIERFYIDLSGDLLFGSIYKGCSVNYGDRYVMEGPDAIWLKYSSARKDGASEAVLDTLLQDYYESKYYGDPIGLQVAIKQMRVEPWVHSTIVQVQEYSVTALDKARKGYFTEWKSTTTQMDWVNLTADELGIKLIEYVMPKLIDIKEEITNQNYEQFFTRQMMRPQPVTPPTT